MGIMNPTNLSSHSFLHDVQMYEFYSGFYSPEVVINSYSSYVTFCMN